MKEVARYTEPYLAHIAKGLLESEGITAAIMNENSSPVSYTHLDVYKRQINTIIAL